MTDSETERRRSPGRDPYESDVDYRAQRMARLGELMDEYHAADPEMVAREAAVLARVREERLRRAGRP